MRKLLLIAILAGCSGGAEYTYGEAAELMATAYCERLTECRFNDVVSNPERCIRRQRFELCELDGYCDVPVDNYENLIAECIDSLYAMPDDQCYNLYDYPFTNLACVKIIQQVRSDALSNN